MTQLTKEMFLKSVSQSEMTVINDDGLNKHLRFSAVLTRQDALLNAKSKV